GGSGAPGYARTSRARASASPSRSAFNQRFAAFRRLSRVLTRRLLPFGAWRPLTQAGRRFESGDRTRWVGGDSLAADRRRPSARLDQCAQVGVALSNARANVRV